MRRVKVGVDDRRKKLLEALWLEGMAWGKGESDKLMSKSVEECLRKLENDK